MWDHLAIARRLAALEDRVESLTVLFESASIFPRVSLPFDVLPNHQQSFSPGSEAG